MKVEWNFTGYIKSSTFQYYDDVEKRYYESSPTDLVGSWTRPDNDHKIKWTSFSIRTGETVCPAFVVNSIVITYDVGVCRLG